MNESIHVVVVDDHSVVRTGLRLLLERERDIGRVSEASSAEEALELIATDHPDVALLDIEMPGMGGLAGAQRIRMDSPDVHVLMLSMHDEIDEVRRAFAAGAHGYVVKTAADQELVRAVRAVAKGERYVDPSLGARLAAPARARGPVDELSPREREVLRLLALGYTNQEIARDLVVSVRTVESHRAHLLTKLGAQSRAELVRHALSAGLLEEEIRS